jgi:hypothetical protein
VANPLGNLLAILVNNNTAIGKMPEETITTGVSNVMVGSFFAGGNVNKITM